MKLLFRDGEHEIPDHLAALMSGMDTAYMTVEEAIAKVNQEMLSRHIDPIVDKMIADHLEGLR